MLESHSYFAVCYKLDGAERYFVWYGDETDGVLLALPNRLATFQNLAALDEYLLQHGLVRDASEPSHFDFDQLASWLSNPSAATADCSFLLDCWNMFSDVSRSAGLAMPPYPGATDVYDKLFFGCNLPAVTPPGEQFIPRWSASEIATISKALSDSLQAFRQTAAYAG